MADALLQTKLHIPPQRPNLVPRPNLFDLLEQGMQLNQRLTLVAAPAGFGKTTLVADWLRQAGHPVAWLTLDERENDPARFLAYLIAALNRVDRGIGNTVETLSRSPQPPETESLLTLLINDISAFRKHFTLTIDDYQAINNPAVHNLLAFLLENQPPLMHLVILSREDPPLPIARWRARGQVNDIRQQDLRFTGVEANYFLNGIMALDLEEGEVTSLQQRTEGWIAGLQLAALSMRGQEDPRGFVRSFTGSSRYILDYLFEEVFKRQSADVKSFLLQTSILERLSAPLCDAVTNSSNSQDLLQQLERANLFLVPADQSRTWYRYHRLFAEFLRHRLRITNTSYELELQRRAGHWFEEHACFEEALNHMLAAADWPEAERLLVMAAVEAIRYGQLLTVQRWLDVFPDDIVENSYNLTALKAFGFLLAGQLEEAAAFTEMARKILPAEPSSFNLGFLTALRSYLALIQGDFLQAQELASKALDYLEEEDPYYLRGSILNSLAQALTQSGDLKGAIKSYQQIVRLSQETNQSLFAVGPLSSQAWLLHLQGKRREAMARCQDVISLCNDTSDRELPVSGAAHMVLGIMHYEANDLETARIHLLKARNFGDQMGLASGIPHFCRIHLARLQLAAGEEKAAQVTIDEARQIANRYQSPAVSFMVAGAEADLCLRQGDVAAAEHFVERFALSPDDTPTHASESHYFTFARLLLAKKKLIEVNRLLANLEQFAAAGGRQRTLITVYILQALAWQAQRREEQAILKLESALRLAAPEKYRRAFLEEDSALFPLLAKIQQESPHFVHQLLEEEPVELGRRASGGLNQPLLVPLSDREIEVLNLIASGLSNQEIADRLFISLGTVKTHAHSIYGKLDVGGRTQAVARAREIQLL